MFNSSEGYKTGKAFLLVLILLTGGFLRAQDIPLTEQKYIFFPHAHEKKWTTAIGVTVTTLPYEITEELHFRVPAADLHTIRQVGKKLFIDGRLAIQGIQNLATIGPRFPVKLGDRFAMALGNDIGFWFGFVNVGGLKTRGRGWQNYPNISFGYRFNKAVLLTLRAESIMNIGVKTYAGDTEVTTDYRLFSGSAYTVALEQPFSGKKNISLAFRAIYTDFFWQTWTLFEPYNRNLFFPQVIIGLIL